MMQRTLLIAVFLWFGLAGCSSPAATAPPGAKLIGKSTLAPAVTPEMAIKMEPGWENPHALGGIPMLLWLQPNVDAPNTNVTITMPSELTVLTGAPAWAGDLKANQGLYLNLVVQIPALTRPGFIQVDSVSYPTDGSKLVKTYKLYLRPTADGKVEFSQTPFTN